MQSLSSPAVAHGFGPGLSVALLVAWRPSFWPPGLLVEAGPLQCQGPLIVDVPVDGWTSQRFDVEPNYLLLTGRMLIC